LAKPLIFAFDPSGDLWVPTGNRILEFTPPFSSGMPASLVIGQKNFTTNFPARSKDGLLAPSAVAFDQSGNMWVLDVSNRVLEFIPPFNNGMNASLVIGQTSFENYQSSTTQSGLSFPEDA